MIQTFNVSVNWNPAGIEATIHPSQFNKANQFEEPFTQQEEHC